MAISTSQIRSELLPDLMEVSGKYQQIPTQWSGLFDRKKSSMAYERSSSMAYLAVAAIKAEGQAMDFDNTAGERYVYQAKNLSIALGYAITREAIEDNLYKSEWDPNNLGLMDAFARTKETFGADILNTATVYDATIGGDGQPLCSTAHPVDGGSFANRPATDLSLNEGALESSSIQIRNFRDNRNQRMFARARKLIVPKQLWYVAERLLKTELRPGTANNDVNAIVSTKTLPDGYIVMDYLTSQYAWFIKTDKPGLIYLDRTAFDTDMQVEATTQNLLVTGYERYKFSYNDPRAIYGSFPTS